MKDYYKILEIQPDASLEVMNNAYRALVRKYHPDLYHTKQKGPMTAKMQEINEAYNTLSVPAARAEYDRRYTTKPSQPATKATSSSLKWKTLLVWALGTFILVRYFIKPFLFSPLGKVVMLCAVLFMMFILMRAKRKP